MEDLDKLSKEELIDRINDLKAQLNRGKYGLYFDRKNDAELVVKESMHKIPVLHHDKNKDIANRGKDNLLIEGDNLYCLMSLSEIYPNGIADIIYIDPPYNTGNNDFVFNDKFVDGDDGYRHTKWLNFMEKRLVLAKRILKDDGVIFISIDDHEFAQLKLLCDSIFGENNYISNCFVLDNLKGKTNDNFVTSIGSKLLIYAKNKSSIEESGFNKIENVFGETVESKYSLEDEEGVYNLITFKKTGQSKFREDRPYMFYPILQKNGLLFSISPEEYEKIYDSKNKKFNDEFLLSLKKKYSDYEFILPKDTDGKYLRWTSGYQTFINKMNKDVVYSGGIKQKVRPTASETLQTYSSGTPKSLFYKTSYSMGTDDLKKVLKNSNFDFPKPVSLIKDILKLRDSKDYTIVDFFAGSGTTAQAVLELNKEDGGNRKFILCTNNENNIMDDVCYPRIKTVITGVRPDGTKYSDGLPGSLRYFKVDFSEDTSGYKEQAKYSLAEKCDDLLCVFEECYDKHDQGMNYNIYLNSSKDKLLSIYNNNYESKSFDEMLNKIKQINSKENVIYYYYEESSGDAYLEQEVLEKIPNAVVKPMPSKIYEIYKDMVIGLDRTSQK